MEVYRRIYIRKSRLTAPLTRRRKTKFPTVYPTIYLPKWKFWIQLSPNCLHWLINILYYLPLINCIVLIKGQSILTWGQQYWSLVICIKLRSNIHIWAVTCDFQQCGVLTSVDSDEPVQPPFKVRNLKWCSVSSLTLIWYSSDKQRLWSDSAYVQADLRLCWSHIPHCWKSHSTAHLPLEGFILLARSSIIIK